MPSWLWTVGLERLLLVALCEALTSVSWPHVTEARMDLSGLFGRAEGGREPVPSRAEKDSVCLPSSVGEEGRTGNGDEGLTSPCMAPELPGTFFQTPGGIIKRQSSGSEAELSQALLLCDSVISKS